MPISEKWIKTKREKKASTNPIHAQIEKRLLRRITFHHLHCPSLASHPLICFYLFIYIFFDFSLSLSLFLSSFIQSIGFRSHRRSSKQIFVKYFFNLLSSFYYYTLHTHLEQPPAPLSFFRLNSGENCNSQSQPALKAYKSRRQVK